MKEEIWKPIKGYEGLYEVSSWGRVRSLDRWVNKKNGLKSFHKGRIRKLNNLKNGYLVAHLVKKCKPEPYYVHRLVAQAFIENPDNLPIINHKDEVKTNNHVENLEWCTHSYNINYGTAKERQRENAGKKTSKKVYQYTMDGELIKVWKSASEVQRQLGFGGHISSCCRGKKKTGYGYIWSYTPLDDAALQEAIDNKYDKKVYQYTLDGELVKVWNSVSDIKKQLGYGGHISSCCTGKAKTSHGYIWRHTPLPKHSYDEVIYKLIDRVCKGQWFDEDKMLEYVNENYKIPPEMIKHDFTILYQLRNTLQG